MYQESDDGDGASVAQTLGRTYAEKIRKELIDSDKIVGDKQEEAEFLLGIAMHLYMPSGSLTGRDVTDVMLDLIAVIVHRIVPQGKASTDLKNGQPSINTNRLRVLDRVMKEASGTVEKPGDYENQPIEWAHDTPIIQSSMIVKYGRAAALLTRFNVASLLACWFCRRWVNVFRFLPPRQREERGHCSKPSRRSRQQRVTDHAGMDAGSRARRASAPTGS